jgi:hypothetical protein
MVPLRTFGLVKETQRMYTLVLLESKIKRIGNKSFIKDMPIELFRKVDEFLLNRNKEIKLSASEFVYVINLFSNRQCKIPDTLIYINRRKIVVRHRNECKFFYDRSPTLNGIIYDFRFFRKYHCIKLDKIEGIEFNEKDLYLDVITLPFV